MQADSQTNDAAATRLALPLGICGASYHDERVSEEGYDAQERFYPRSSGDRGDVPEAVEIGKLRAAVPSAVL
jgi:hypothetical protein